MAMEEGLSLTDYDYPLPPGRIAQRPAEPRDGARLLVSRPEGVTDRFFYDLPALLAPGDVLAINDTRVIPARLLAHKDSGGRVEILLLKPTAEEGVWECLLKANKPVRPGVTLRIAEDFSARVEGRREEIFLVRLAVGRGALAEALARHGRLPLPPYITDSDPREDVERYQTVFSRHQGAVAAPTAGLHFTPGLLEAISAMGVLVARLTLHVGLGTFQPIREDDPARHVIHREWCQLDGETADHINRRRQMGGRLLAVGTTAVRTLETAADEEGRLRPFSGETGLYILPGYRFRAVDRMITNFHLPKTTLLLLVAAFIGKGRLDRDYAHAVASGYRFYSYGDATFLEP